VVGRGEGAEPGDGEGVTEHNLQAHPAGTLGPASLLLLQLLDALGDGEGERERGGFNTLGWVCSGLVSWFNNNWVNRTPESHTSTAAH
jgi:hypothetical protein